MENVISAEGWLPLGAKVRAAEAKIGEACELRPRSTFGGTWVGVGRSNEERTSYGRDDGVEAAKAVLTLGLS